MASTETYLKRVEVFAQLLEKQFPTGKLTGIEIGVYKADFSYYMLERMPRLTMIMVDPFQHYKEFKREYSQAWWDALYGRVVLKMDKFGKRCKMLRMTSEEAAKKLKGEAHLVFIDAMHDEQNVALDLTLWTPRILKKGIVGGHDYSMAKDAGGGGVIRAVDAFVQKKKLELVTPDVDTVWYFIKR